MLIKVNNAMTEATEFNAKGHVLHPGIEVNNAMTEATEASAQVSALPPEIEVNNVVKEATAVLQSMHRDMLCTLEFR